jgi:hypothetical protein
MACLLLDREWTLTRSFADTQRHFRVSPLWAYQTIITLEGNGLIRRHPAFGRCAPTFDSGSP